MSSLANPPRISSSLTTPSFFKTFLNKSPPHRNIKLRRKSSYKFSIFCHGNDNEGFRSSNIEKITIINQKNQEKQECPPARRTTVKKSFSKFYCNYESEDKDRDNSLPINLRMNGSGFPISLRIIKMKKKLASNEIETIPFSLASSIMKLISSLLLMMEELLSLVFKGESIGKSIIFSREMSDSLVLMLKKVFFNSPNLFLWNLNLVADLIFYSVSNSVASVWLRDLAELEMGDTCKKNDKWIDRRRIIYERLIFDDPKNSLILTNYAQFLYKIAKDNDKAEELFVRATRVEPPDAEAFSQYAIFLWKIRRDLDAAEEAFLTAIDTDNENCHYDSNYACFLWETGAPDTCFPLNNSS